jgi:hypothetical protein
MKYSPPAPFCGACAAASAPTTGLVPVFSMLPSAFSSIVDRPPATLPSVGWEPSRSAPLASISAR